MLASRARAERLALGTPARAEGLAVLREIGAVETVVAELAGTPRRGRSSRRGRTGSPIITRLLPSPRRTPSRTSPQFDSSAPTASDDLRVADAVLRDAPSVVDDLQGLELVAEAGRDEQVAW